MEGTNEPRTMWHFSVKRPTGSDQADYAIGETEEQAIADLARRRNAESWAYDSGILGGVGGWVLIVPNHPAIWVHRGTKMPPAPPVTR